MADQKWLYRQWRHQPFKSGGDFRAVKARDTSRGVRWHAPPENFWNLESLKYDFLHFQGKIIRNSEDYKVKKHTIFSWLYVSFSCVVMRSKKLMTICCANRALINISPSYLSSRIKLPHHTLPLALNLGNILTHYGGFPSAVVICACNMLMVNTAYMKRSFVKSKAMIF
jgi:hypothetical protein